jgi:hypothetical protein
MQVPIRSCIKVVRSGGAGMTPPIFHLYEQTHTKELEKCKRNSNLFLRPHPNIDLLPTVLIYFRRPCVYTCNKFSKISDFLRRSFLAGY